MVEKQSQLATGQPRYTLETLFHPQAIAVIGATERFPSVGYTIITNLLEQAAGRQIYPINLRRKQVLGLKTYTHIQNVPEPIDLAVIATPAPTVPGLVKACAKAKVKGAIIISSGFREMGQAGLKLEQQIQLEVERSPMRLIGPNCLGVMNPYTALNASIATTMVQPGTVGVISQSGAFDAAILDWSLQDRVGFSAFISLGSMLDVDWGEAITYLGNDRHTRSIVIYMETINDPRSFLSAARKVALDKPIVVLKAGRTELAAKVAASHTGTITGSDAALDAALRRVGVLRVTQTADLFHIADVLAKQPRPRGPRLTILTNAGGPGILAMDTLISDGSELADLSPESLTALHEFLPSHWSQSNPIDILGDADPLRYVKAFNIVATDPNSDALLVILTPQDTTAPTQTARELKKLAPRYHKPLLACWMGGADTAAGKAILTQANIPTFTYPDTAASVFTYMWRYSRNLRSLYETPVPPAAVDQAAIDRPWAATVLQTAQQMERTLLTEFEAKQVLAAYGIPTVETYLAVDEGDAVQYATEIGYPVVLKLYSATIIHKSAVGGVHLNLNAAQAVHDAYRVIKSSIPEADFQGVTVQPMMPPTGYELILGSSVDPQFGPILLFGMGGRMTPIFQGQALGLPPLTSTLARRMMEQTHIYQYLQQQVETETLDLSRLAQILVQFSHLVVEQPRIKEIDINPLLISGEQVLALDANIILHPATTLDVDLPKPAIRPYPSQYRFDWQLKDGRPVEIRPIRPEDEGLIGQFHHTLSDKSVYYRFFQMIPLARRIDHDRLSRICFIDYDREIALVLVSPNPNMAESTILGVARLVKQTNTVEAEFALLVSDAWQRQGIGSKLMQSLIVVAREEGLQQLVGRILPENVAMQALCKKLGFTVQHRYEEGAVEARLNVSTDY